MPPHNHGPDRPADGIDAALWRRAWGIAAQCLPRPYELNPMHKATKVIAEVLCATKESDNAST